MPHNYAESPPTFWDLSCWQLPVIESTELNLSRRIVISMNYLASDLPRKLKWLSSLARVKNVLESDCHWGRTWIWLNQLSPKTFKETPPPQAGFSWYEEYIQLTAADPKVAHHYGWSFPSKLDRQGRVGQEYSLFLNYCLYNIFHFSSKPAKYLLFDLLWEKKFVDLGYKSLTFNLWLVFPKGL